ncbi:hypothetical protein JCM14076_08830 [Methylosoma difficile]
MDLPEHRKQAMDACLRQGIFPKAMEHLPARDADAIKVSLEMVDVADIYIGIYAWRYGHVPEGHDISVTEMEFNHAVKRGIPILVFLIHKDHALTIDMVETRPGAQEKLAALKDKACEGRGRAEFKSPEDLRAEIVHALGEELKRQQTESGKPPTPQFHPTSHIPKAPETYIAHPYTLLQSKNVVGRQAELNLLTDWVTRNQQVPADVRLFNVVAIGGMGKSALTWKWFNDIAPLELPKLAGRLWWSFYESDAHYENFIIRALAYIAGISEQDSRSLPPPEREERLFRCLDEQPFLLVLDGLERILLAYARMDAAYIADDDLDERTANQLAAAYGLPDNIKETYLEKHRLRRCADPRAGRFLRRLAQVRASRVLISTRLYPAELQSQTAQPLPGCFAVFLEGLKDDDALNLWREFGVSGARDDLLPVFNAFGNYPLLLRALAGEIADYRPAPGDFGRWRKANPKFDPTRLDLKNAKTHVLQYALQGLGEVQKQVLHTLAAFRMPAGWETLESLFNKFQESGTDQQHDNEEETRHSGRDCRNPEHRDVNNENNPVADCHPWPLDSLTRSDGSGNPCRNDGSPQSREQTLDQILTELEDRGLVGWDRRANRYDLHPIARGVVWAALADNARQTVFSQLHGYFDAAPRPPNYLEVESLEDLTPAIELYHTLIGLGRYDDAFVVFRDHLDYAMLWRLSASRQRVEWLERLFPDGWQALPSLASARDSSCALNALGQAYLFSGELARAALLLRRKVDIDEAEQDENNAAVGLCNLSDGLLMSGQLRAAETSVMRALTISRKNENGIQAGIGERWRGSVLAARGIADAAETALRRSLAIFLAEQVQQSEGVDNAYLAQQQLWQHQPAAALPLANRAWELAKIRRHECDFIRAARLQGEAALGLNDLATAEERLHHALNRARAVNFVEEELPALTALAELHRRREDYATARDLLEQVWDAAEHGPYPLVHADARNVLAQIERDQVNIPAAIAAATRAYQLAWCDGPPYAYHFGLSNARRHLQALGAPEPDLPPFDESKYEPMPEVELNPRDEFYVDLDNLADGC